MTSPVLCLASPRGCGKDTLYTRLHSLYPLFRRAAFADSLKDDLEPFILHHFGFNIWTCTAEQKELVRPLMIAYGCAQREVDIDYWVKRVVDQIKEVRVKSPASISVITDVRFASEWECLQRNFGDSLILVNIERDGAPPPTSEEEKHFRKVASLAHYTLRWGNDTEEQQLAHARRVLEWVGLSAQ